MRTAKKALGIALVLTMLLNVVALVSYAAVPADTVCQLTLKADKESYMPGDDIVITVYAQTAAECPSVTMAGQYEIGYASSAIEPYAPDSTDLLAQGFVPEATEQSKSFSNSESQFVPHSVLTGDMGMTVTEGQGFDEICGYWISQPENQFVASVDAPVELFSFKMKVKADAADGDYVIAFNKDGYDNYNAYITDSVASGLYGSSGPDFGFTSTNMFALDSIKIHVGAATEASFIKDGGAQIRFRGIGSTGTVADYQGEFDVRTVATISQADFVANFGTDENAIAKITDIGFVYATAANVPTFDLATAKAVAEGTASEGYVKKAVQSIQHAGDGEAYKFTCLIENIADTDKEQTVNALAYVCFDGTYYYFDAAATVDFAALYERMPK